MYMVTKLVDNIFDELNLRSIIYKGPNDSDKVNCSTLEGEANQMLDIMVG